jgi:hypothetical protein
VDLLDPEGPACSLKRLVSRFLVYTLVFNLTEAIMLDSISTASSCIQVKVAPLLSLKRRAKSGSKAPAKVTLAGGWEGLTSAEI